MKKILGLLSVLSILVCCSFRPPVDQMEIDDVVVALRSGNAAQLSKYFDNRVDLSLPEKADNYSRSQAEMIMRDFFSSNGVRDFALRNKGGTVESNYCVGTLQTKSGNYRTTVFMHQRGSRFYLQDLRFQRL